MDLKSFASCDRSTAKIQRNLCCCCLLVGYLFDSILVSLLWLDFARQKTLFADSIYFPASKYDFLVIMNRLRLSVFVCIVPVYLFSHIRSGYFISRWRANEIAYALCVLYQFIVELILI